MKVLVVGASLKTERYSNMAVNMLLDYGHEVVAIGGREGQIRDVEIIKGHPPMQEIDTITLYLGPARQPTEYEYLISLNPKRVIFNPGTENPVFENMLKEHNIVVLRACTLVLLRTNQFEYATGEEE